MGESIVESRGGVTRQWCSAAVMRDDVSTCVQSSMPGGVGVGSFAAARDIRNPKIGAKVVCGGARTGARA